jgi:hypothetical protein
MQLPKLEAKLVGEDLNSMRKAWEHLWKEKRQEQLKT